MKNKFIILTVIITLITVLCACEASTNITNDVNDISLEKIIKKSSKTNYVKSIKNTYNANDLISELTLNFTVELPSLALSRPSSTIKDINNDYPIEYLKENGELLYAIYKVEQGGNVYVFFRDTKSDGNIYYLGLAYITKCLSKSDFEKIKSGNNISKVFEIEPASRICVSVNDEISKSVEEDHIQYIILLTTDGFYYVSYDINTRLIKKIELIKADLAEGILTEDLPQN